MLSFIRKRLPSKDRNNEHLQHAKLNHNQHQNDDNDDEIKRTQSTNELNSNDNKKKKEKKHKKKTKSSSTLNELVPTSNASQTINKSYSDIDYFPMMPGALSRPNNQIASDHDSLSDCYFNPSENLPTSNERNYVQAPSAVVNKPRTFEIPVIDCRKEQNILKYKDVDHQKTKALRDVTEQRTQERSVK